MPLMKKGSTAVAEAPATEVATPEQLAKVDTVKKAVAKAASSEVMTKADWGDKDRRISRQGLFQAALQSTGLLQLNTGNTLEDYLKLVEQTAERGLEFVNRK
jgi:hypothetical protein